MNIIKINKMEVNRDYLSRDIIKPKVTISKKELLEDAVKGFLIRNGVGEFVFDKQKETAIQWNEEDCMSIHMSCANDSYTMAMVMLQALFIPNNYGYVSYRHEDYSFKIQFRIGAKTAEQVVEYIERARVNVSVKYKGALV